LLAVSSKGAKKRSNGRSHGWWHDAVALVRREPFWLIAVALAVVAGVVVWMVWPAGEEPPRARQYREAVACLLTDDRGITSPQAAAVWSGMQDASVQTLVRVQYLQVAGAQTKQNAETFLGTLVQSKCAVILAVGKPPLEALPAIAAQFPDRRFVAIGGSATGSNVSSVYGDTGTLEKAGHDRVAEVAAQ
jgi:basic membrane lipoprotein Med (substrate-binding protein (PBP1-ABC) superfamily)